MSANDFIGRSPRIVRHKVTHVVQQNPTKDEWVGLGDIVEKVTEFTGIKKIVETVKPKGCGCNKRKKMLNKVRLYRRDRK